MKITKAYLRRIITEEMQNMRETEEDPFEYALESPLAEFDKVRGEEEEDEEEEKEEDEEEKDFVEDEFDLMQGQGEWSDEDTELYRSTDWD